MNRKLSHLFRGKIVTTKTGEEYLVRNPIYNAGEYINPIAITAYKRIGEEFEKTSVVVSVEDLK